MVPGSRRPRPASELRRAHRRGQLPREQHGPLGQLPGRVRRHVELSSTRRRCGLRARGRGRDRRLQALHGGWGRSQARDSVPNHALGRPRPRQRDGHTRLPARLHERGLRGHRHGRAPSRTEPPEWLQRAKSPSRNTPLSGWTRTGAIGASVRAPGSWSRVAIRRAPTIGTIVVGISRAFDASLQCAPRKVG